MRFRLYDVEVRGFDPVMISAESPGQARYQCFLRFSESYPAVTFRDFLAASKVRPRSSTPADDGYAYVRRAYGVDPKIGQRVRLRNEADWTGREGEVVYPGQSTAHVHVLVDGEKYPCTVHPSNVELLPTPTPDTRGER